MKLGNGKFTYTIAEGWEKRPPDMRWREVAAVAVDPNDNVYMFTRDPAGVVVCDRDGNVKNSWGEGLFVNPHGLTIGLEGDTLFCTDSDGHAIRKCTLDGKVLLTIGTPGRMSGLHSGKPFNKCTHVALDPKSGNIYVSDGYGNSAVHKYSPDGKHLFSWGKPGTDPGEFNLPHNIATDKDGYVYVADRENHRIQIFDSSGAFQDQLVNMHRPCAIYISKDQYLYSGELGFGMPVTQKTPNIGPRVSIYNTKGEIEARLGDQHSGIEGRSFFAPHGIAVDSQGDLYVAEVANTQFSQFGQPDPDIRSIQKFIRSE